VVSQHLLPSAHPGQKRVLAMEILLNNSAVAGSLRAGKIETLDNIILTGRAEGMLTLDESIKQRLREGSISRETAERFAR
jgi:twitching motility protein PilT